MTQATNATLTRKLNNGKYQLTLDKQAGQLNLNGEMVTSWESVEGGKYVEINTANHSALLEMADWYRTLVYSNPTACDVYWLTVRVYAAC